MLVLLVLPCLFWFRDDEPFQWYTSIPMVCIVCIDSNAYPNLTTQEVYDILTHGDSVMSPTSLAFFEMGSLNACLYKTIIRRNWNRLPSKVITSLTTALFLARAEKVRRGFPRMKVLHKFNFVLDQKKHHKASLFLIVDKDSLGLSRRRLFRAR